MSNEEDKLYERLELWNNIEELFDLNNENNYIGNKELLEKKQIQNLD